ncbi:PKD domain-containing protein, partial [Natronolimnohabitans sp. A-GB9]|uniref:PKD domain-containing protein n=1 Tax=Natronolimnohabitans sp. A-GB9 TaxID=3069757 RepID=UPI0027B0EF88
ELEITDNGGGTDTITKTVTVDEERPTAEFEITPSDPGPDEEFELDASMSEAPAGEITEYDWSVDESYSTGDWEGDSSLSGETVTGVYQGVGEYEIELEVTDNGGATDSVTKTVDVGGDGPTADFDFSSPSPAPNEEIVFDASGSEIPAGDTVTYDWSYETADDGDGSSSGESVTHSFENYGEFNVTLTVVDEFDRSDSVVKNVSISGEGPTADFEYSPSDPDLDERVIFDGSVTTEPDLTIEEYRWFINGERQGSGSEATVVFDEAGVYNIELEVENTGGKTDRINKNLPVGDEAAIIGNPDFELVRSSPESKSVDVNPGETASFISELKSEEVPEATKVLYVDGTFINRSNVDSKTLRTAHQFEEIGEHTVEVEVEGAAGKSDIAQWDVTTHTFNSLPTVADQSSSKSVDLNGNTETLTFSIQNPEVNDRDIEAETIAELPDGISISAASGVSSGDAAVQTATETVAPGHQESMRLDINIEDESLDGQRVTIPYQIKYQPVGDENVSYTSNEQGLEVIVGSAQEGESGGEATNDGVPGFGVIPAVVSILLLMIGMRRMSPRK